MQGSFDKQPQGDRSAYQSFSIKLVALPVLFIVALIGMAVSRSVGIQVDFGRSAGCRHPVRPHGPRAEPGAADAARPADQPDQDRQIQLSTQELASYSILNSTPNFAVTRPIRPDGRHFIKFRPTETLKSCAISSSFCRSCPARFGWHQLAPPDGGSPRARRSARIDRRRK